MGFCLWIFLLLRIPDSGLAHLRSGIASRGRSSGTWVKSSLDGNLRSFSSGYFQLVLILPKCVSGIYLLMKLLASGTCLHRFSCINMCSCSFLNAAQIQSPCMYSAGIAIASSVTVAAIPLLPVLVSLHLHYLCFILLKLIAGHFISGLKSNIVS